MVVGSCLKKVFSFSAFSALVFLTLGCARNAPLSISSISSDTPGLTSQGGNISVDDNALVGDGSEGVVVDPGSLVFPTVPILRDTITFPINVALPPVLPSWCGVSTIPDSTGVATILDGDSQAAYIPCHGHEPWLSCPNGFTRLRVSLLPNVGAASAGAVATCVPQATTRAVPDQQDASWCGASISNRGTYSSMWLGGVAATGTSISCLNQNPVAACPAGYARLSIQTTNYHSDSRADTFHTCIRKPGGTGSITSLGAWYGLSASAGVPAASNAPAGVTYQAMSPATACPNGSTVFLMGSAGWGSQSKSSTTRSCIQSSLTF